MRSRHRRQSAAARPSVVLSVPRMPTPSPPPRRDLAGALVAALCVLLASSAAYAHGVADSDKLFLEGSSGSQLIPFVYLGAKHMVTGYDHLLFLVGVIFFLHRMKEVATYVSLFAVGHSVTLLYGVLSGTDVNPYFVDAIIGLSVAYKGLDNLGMLERWFGFQPNTKAAVLGFGLIHGFGLATKLQDFELDDEGLVGNIIAFNVGVELGQFLALAAILVGMRYWRRSESFEAQAKTANKLLIAAGVGLFLFQVQLGLTAEPPAPVDTFQSDEISVTLEPGHTTEVKAVMTEGSQFTWSWAVEGGRVYYDFHGEPKGAAADVFTSFETGTADSADGEFEAPFTGVHGWYWKNKGLMPVTVRLKTSGMYSSISQLY